MKQEKKYLKPEMTIIEFNNEDIILTSGNDPWGDTGQTTDTDIP